MDQLTSLEAKLESDCIKIQDVSAKILGFDIKLGDVSIKLDGLGAQIGQMDTKFQRTIQDDERGIRELQDVSIVLISFKDRLSNVLKPVRGAAFDSNGVATGCLPNTRVGLLMEVGDWLANANSPTVFWLSGLAGTGDSVAFPSSFSRVNF